MMRAALDAAELKSVEELERLRPEWTALWQQCRSATPFQSPAWTIPWWRHFGRSELLAVTLRSGGALVGFAPCFIWDDPPFRKIVPVGAGITDYLDALFLPGYEQSGPAALFGYFGEIQDRWDLFWSPDLRQDAVLLNSPPPNGWRDESIATECAPVLRLPNHSDQLAEAVPESKLRKLRYYRRRTAKLGGIAVERALASNLDELFAAMVHLHGAEWRAKGQSGMLAASEIQAFHREAAEAMLAADVLRLYGLRLNGTFVASLYAFSGNGISCVYLGAYDPSLAQLGLGTLAVGTAIEEAVAEGAREFHFLRGREQHKYSWGAVDVPTYTRTLIPRPSSQ